LHQEHSSDMTALPANFFHHPEKHIKSKCKTKVLRNTLKLNALYHSSLLNIKRETQLTRKAPQITWPLSSCSLCLFLHLLHQMQQRSLEFLQHILKVHQTDMGTWQWGTFCLILICSLKQHFGSYDYTLVVTSTLINNNLLAEPRV
jgi:hypothetical protein